MERAQQRYEGAYVDLVDRVTRMLASKYGFDAEDGLNEVLGATLRKRNGSEKQSHQKPKNVGPAFPLPFCGVKVNSWCRGVRLNHGLYSQCTQGAVTDDGFCKTCQNQLEKKSQLTYGTIEERIAAGDKYRDPKGKAATPYGNVMQKLNISKERANS